MDEFALIEDVKVKSVYCQENGDIYEVLKEAKKRFVKTKSPSNTSFQRREHAQRLPRRFRLGKRC